MKAILLKQFGSTQGFHQEEVPDPLPKRGEVRIRIRAAGFNPVDCKMRAGGYANSLPIILGADCSGVIDAVSDPFHEFAKGDEVLAFVFGQGSNGTYAESVCIPTSFVVKKPKNISFEQAASFPLAGLTAYRALVYSGALQEGKAAFIAGGSGGVGAIAMQLAHYYKAFPIFTTAGSDSSLEHLIKNLHVSKDYILQYKGLSLEQMIEKLIQMNQGELFPATFDFVGKTMKQLCFALTDYGGHLATILREPEGFPIEFWGKNSVGFNKGMSVHFIFVGAESFYGTAKNWNLYRQQLTHLMELIKTDDLKIFDPEVVGNFCVDTVKKAHEKLETGHAGRKLVMRMRN